VTTSVFTFELSSRTHRLLLFHHTADMSASDIHFASLDLSQATQDAIKDMGFTTMTEIQQYFPTLFHSLSFSFPHYSPHIGVLFLPCWLDVMSLDKQRPAAARLSLF